MAEGDKQENADAQFDAMLDELRQSAKPVKLSDQEFDRLLDEFQQLNQPSLEKDMARAVPNVGQTKPAAEVAPPLVLYNSEQDALLSQIEELSRRCQRYVIAASNGAESNSSTELQQIIATLESLKLTLLKHERATVLLVILQQRLLGIALKNIEVVINPSQASIDQSGNSLRLHFADYECKLLRLESNHSRQMRADVTDEAMIVLLRDTQILVGLEVEAVLGVQRLHNDDIPPASAGSFLSGPHRSRAGMDFPVLDVAALQRRHC